MLVRSLPPAQRTTTEDLFRRLEAPLRRAPADTVDTLVAAIAAHDPATAEHSRRVADLAVALARALQLTEGSVEIVRRAALLHDVGKLGIPVDVLRKPAELEAAEQDLIQLHSIIGAGILARLPGMDTFVSIILHHHERWDGAGYPRGVGGADIPVESRVIFVADAFDAMTTTRAYGKVLGVDAALAELLLHAGSQFDPLVVDAAYEAFALTAPWSL